MTLTLSMRITAPSDILSDFSASSGWAPSAIAAGSPGRKVVISNGTPLMKLVDVVVKYCCCGDGARKPFCSEPRRPKLLLKS